MIARVLVGTLDEYSGVPAEVVERELIDGEPAIGAPLGRDDPGGVLRLESEDSTVGEGLVRFDVRARVRVLGTDDDGEPRLLEHGRQIGGGHQPRPLELEALEDGSHGWRNATCQNSLLYYGMCYLHAILSTSCRQALDWRSEFQPSLDSSEDRGLDFGGAVEARLAGGPGNTHVGLCGIVPRIRKFQGCLGLVSHRLHHRPRRHHPADIDVSATSPEQLVV